MSIEEYFNLFSQKKNKSHIEEVFLIDAMKKNVSYSTQSSALNWRKLDSLKASIFYNHIQILSKTDWDLCQLKHWLPWQTNPIISIPTKSLCSQQQSSTTYPKKKYFFPGTETNTTTFLPISSSSIKMKLKPLSGVTDLFARKQINLNSVVVVVKKKSLKVPDIKKICDYYK